MSEERSGSPFITPTFSTVLNSNLLTFTEKLNEGFLFDSYEVLKTIVDMLKEEDQKELRNNGFDEVDRQLGEALKLESVDLYTTRQKRRRASETIVRRNIRNLFRKVMLQLHRKGYLEKKGVQPRAKGPSRLRV